MMARESGARHASVARLMEETRSCCADEILRRIRGEYLEMPGLRLSLTQACRLWGLDQSACEAYLKRLVELGFLACSRDGLYARLDPSSPRRA